MRIQSKSKTKLIAALAATMTLCVGFAVVNEGNQTVANADNATAITVVGAAVRYPAAEETVAKGTGLKFEVKVTGYETAFGENFANVENLGVLVNVDGVPDVENTPNGTVGANVAFIANGVASEEYVYEVKDDGLYMYVELKHVPANYFHHDFVCRAYYDLKEADVVYSDTIQRSAIYVIGEALKDTSANAPSDTRKEELKGLKNASTDHTAATYGEVNEEGTTREATCECGAVVNVPIGKYTYEFDVDGGDAVDSIQAYSYDKVTLPTATKANAKFLGWYIGEEKVEEITVPYAENETDETVTLTAKWLDYLTEAQLTAGVTFDTAEKAAWVEVHQNSIDPVFDTDHVVISTANYDGGNPINKLLVNSDVTLNVGDIVEVTYSTTMDCGLKLNGGYNGLGAQATTVTKQFSVAQAASDGNIIVFSGWGGKDTDNWIKLYSIRVVKPRDLTEAELINGYYFDSADSFAGKLNCDANIATSYDADKNAMKVVNASGNSYVRIKTEELSLSAGDVIVVSVWNTGRDASLVVDDNGTKKYTSVKNSATKFIAYSYTVGTSVTLSSIDIAIYGQVTDFWINFVQIARKNSDTAITISEEQLLAGYTFDSAEKVSGSCSAGASAYYRYNEAENAMQVLQSSTTTKDERCLTFNFKLALNVGDVIKVTFKSPIAGVSVRLNNTSYSELASSATTQYTVKEIEITKNYTDEQGYMSLIYYSAGNYYIQSIQLVHASAQA